MAEERTQAPSKLRRQRARELGQVAHSAELTGAVGLLAAVVLLGAWGGDLARTLSDMIREPLAGGWLVSATVGSVVDRFRSAAWAVVMPLAAILGGAAAAAIGAHQIQVGGLWVPGLLAPEPGRLWAHSAGAGALGRGLRGVWSLAKAAIVVAAATWVIGAHRSEFSRLSRLAPVALATSASHLVRDLAGSLALAVLLLGLVDFALQWRRLEAHLSMTPEEQREELHALDGDPAIRARRRRLARDWRRDPAEILTGSAVLLTAPGGLGVLLAGGPPPRRITVRQVARGPAASILEREAALAGVPRLESPQLARHLARGPGSGASLPPGLAAELAARWPAVDAT